MKSINDRLNASIYEHNNDADNIDEAKTTLGTFYKDYLAPALEDMFYNMTMDHVSDPSEVDFLRACDMYADRYYHNR